MTRDPYVEVIRVQRILREALEADTTVNTLNKINLAASMLDAVIAQCCEDIDDALADYYFDEN
jgi:hypothetical protein